MTTVRAAVSGLLLVAAVALPALAAQVPETPSSVARGPSSGVSSPREVVVRTAVEWEALWTAHAAGDARPVIDFSTELVAAVFLGTRPTGGFRVEITGARRDGDTLLIDMTSRAPGPGDIVAQVQTSPFHIVRLPKHDGPVRFRTLDGRQPR